MSERPDSVDLPDHFSTDLYLQEQVQLLYRGLPLSLISSLIIALILSISHLTVVGQAEIIYWNLILGIILITRLALWQFWLNVDQLYSRQLWLLLFRIGAAAGGIAWGSAAILIYAKDNSIYQALLAFSLAGVVSGSLTSLSSDRISAVSFALLAVCPLSIRIVMDDSPTAVAMSAMSLLFIFFVITSSGRAQKELRKQIRQNEVLLNLSNELQKNREIDSTVTKVQSQFINDKNYLDAMQSVLSSSVQISKSEMGFIAEVLYDAEKKPYMKMMTLDFPKNNPAYEFFKTNITNPLPEFKNLNGIFGSIMQSGKPIFCGNPRHDIRSTGMPEKHPEIFNLVGIPIFHSNQLLAILCLANSTATYSEKTLDLFLPVTNLIGQFINTIQLQNRHKKDLAVLEESNIQTQTILDDIADGIVTIDKYGIIKTFNKAAETIFGYQANQIIDKNVTELMPEYYRADHNKKISDHLKTGKKNIIGIGREVTAVRRNGKHFPMDLMVSRITRNGEPMFIGIMRDVSEKKTLHETHKNELNKLVKELQIPAHAIGLALDMLEKNIQSQKHSSSGNLIKSAKNENDHLQKKLQAVLNDKDSPNHINLKSAKAIDAFNTHIINYKHIAELRGSRFLIVSRIYDEHIQIDDDLLEQAMACFLDIAADNNLPFSEIKVFVEEAKGKIRIYTIEKNNHAEQIKQNRKWQELQQILQKMHASADIEPIIKGGCLTDNLLTYMEFPLAMTKSGFNHEHK
jgi:two-component system, LuxR family, sensor kinase FixL